MRVQVCHDFDEELGECLAPLEWVTAAEVVEAGNEPWLTVEGALVVAAAIGTVWAVAWAYRALAQQLHSILR